MRQIVTDERLAETPGLEGLETEQRLQAMRDARRVYDFLRRSEGQRDGAVPEDGLRAWGERQGISPDRMNAALSVLEAEQRIHVYDDAAEEGAVESAEPAPKGRGS